eukprot:gene7510-8343_t
MAVTLQPRFALKIRKILSTATIAVKTAPLHQYAGYNRSSVDTIFNDMIAGKRSALAHAITLVESTLPAKRSMSEILLSRTLKRLRTGATSATSVPKNKKETFRIGLTGPPGAGKSTFIENFGKHLTSLGNKVAVLAIDPSSAKTGGSLLGDRTRMIELSRDPNAYIRPSPSSGTLGGVTRSTNEAIILCEGTGYNIILVETMGVGQSEFAVRDMVDMFVLIIPPAGGDELQGIKKGIVEVADLILVNKSDGDLVPAARKIQTEYLSALKLLHRHHPLWNPKVQRISSLANDGLVKAWDTMLEYHSIMLESGNLEQTRKNQYRVWMWNHIRDNIMDRFRKHPRVKEIVKVKEMQVVNEIITPGMAADSLLSIFIADSE